MCAAYRSARDTEGDLSARLAAIEERVTDLRDLFGGTAGRTLEDRVTAIERLLVRLEAGLSAGHRPAPQAELDLAPLEARLRSIEGTFVAAIDRLAEQLEAAAQDQAGRLESWRPSEAVADDLATRLSARDRLDDVQQHLDQGLQRLHDQLASAAGSDVDLSPLEERLGSIEETFTGAFERLGQQLEAVAQDQAGRLESWRPSETAAEDLAARLSSRDRIDEVEQHLTEAIERLRERLTQTLESQPDLTADLASIATSVETLHERLGRVVEGNDLTALGDRLQARIDASDASGTVRELQERIDALARAEDLVALTEAVRSLPDGAALAAIEARLGELASADAVAAVTDHLERLDLGAPLTALTDRVGELGDRIARRDDLAALRKQVSEVARAEDLAALGDRLEQPLSFEGLQGVEDRLDLVLAEMRERTDEELQADLQRLRDVVGRLARAEDIEALIELVAGIDGRTQSVATAHDLAAVRERVGDLQRELGQLDVTEPVLLAIREELDRVTTTVLEARRDVAQLAAGDVSELRDRVATLATSSDLELARAHVTELGGTIRTLETTIGRLGGVDETLSALRERVEGLESLVEDRAKTIVDPLDDLHDLVVSRTDALLEPGRIQAALAPMWEGIAGIAEDFAVAREAAQGQQQVIDGLGEVVERVERVASQLHARVEDEQDALTSVVKEGVASELHEVVDEVRKLGASYHRVATDLGEQVQRLRRTNDEVVGALQRRDRLIQDEVVERLVTALDRVVELGGRSRRKVSRALADAAADGAAKAGDWERPPPDMGPTRVTLRREEGEETTELE
ncbi:MAG: hypothetical protein KY469_01895 [Actinobacteria bacterium]|nr:hypothetical protein [Actinomycetota bacterium]